MIVTKIKKQCTTMSKLLLEKLELKQLKQSWKLDQDQLCILAEKQEYLSKYESDLCEICFPQTHPSVVTLNASKRISGLWRSCNPLCYTAIVLYKLKTFPSISQIMTVKRPHEPSIDIWPLSSTSVSWEVAKKSN